jgi:hypothetical protein
MSLRTIQESASDYSFNAQPAAALGSGRISAVGEVFVILARMTTPAVERNPPEADLKFSRPVREFAYEYLLAAR